jgi:hypothetical protein
MKPEAASKVEHWLEDQQRQSSGLGQLAEVGVGSLGCPFVSGRRPVKLPRVRAFPPTLPPHRPAAPYRAPLCLQRSVVSGWLKKSGQSTINAKRRWVVLDGTSLVYYVDRAVSALCRVLLSHLAGCTQRCTRQRTRAHHVARLSC